MRKMSLFAAAASLLAFAAWGAPGPGEIVIAQAAPFSGPLAPTGTHIRAGIQLYIDKVNAGGGIHGGGSSWFPRMTATSRRKRSDW
jgi:ABC-type branched-subunit amino acid transport system substrate-binding protein